MTLSRSELTNPYEGIQKFPSRLTDIILRASNARSRVYFASSKAAFRDVFPALFGLREHLTYFNEFGHDDVVSSFRARQAVEPSRNRSANSGDLHPQSSIRAIPECVSAAQLYGPGCAFGQAVAKLAAPNPLRPNVWRLATGEMSFRKTHGAFEVATRGM